VRPGAGLSELEGVDDGDRRGCPCVKEIEETCDQAVVTGELVAAGTAASKVLGGGCAQVEAHRLLDAVGHGRATTLRAARSDLA